MANAKLEERCKLKDFVERVEKDQKYFRCYSCDGLDKSKYCYVQPAQPTIIYKPGENK